MDAIQLYEGKILTEDGKLAGHEDCCCISECDGACVGATSDEYLATLTGFTQPEENGCDNCYELNDSYVLAPHPTDECVWRIAMQYLCDAYPGPQLVYYDIYLRFLAGPRKIEGLVHIYYSWVGFHTSNKWWFEKLYPSEKIPCSSLNLVDIPFVSVDPPVGLGPHCNAAAPTFVVTAL